MEIKILLQDNNATLPKKATDGSAAFDVCTAQAFAIFPGQSVLIDTGFIIDIPKGWMALLFGRSGLGAKAGIRLSTGVSVIDSDFRQTLKVPLYRDLVDRHWMQEAEELIAPAKFEEFRS